MLERLAERSASVCTAADGNANLIRIDRLRRVYSQTRCEPR
jgi:hypothetical protein